MARQNRKPLRQHHIAANHGCPAQALLSDEQLDYYAEVFMQLNTRYALTAQHHFIFDDFLDNPDVFEVLIHRYFANKLLFENLRGRAKIHLQVFLRYPEVMMAAVNVEEAYHEAEAVKCEHLLPRQLTAARDIELTEHVWFQELVATTFQHHRRVLMRGCALVEPNPLNHRPERKCAGGKR
jgi:hypothetical protein